MKENFVTSNIPMSVMRMSPMTGSAMKLSVMNRVDSLRDPLFFRQGDHPVERGDEGVGGFVAHEARDGQR